MYWNSINASKPKRKKLHEYFITVTVISDRYPVHYIQPPCTSGGESAGHPGQGIRSLPTPPKGFARSGRLGAGVRGRWSHRRRRGIREQCVRGGVLVSVVRDQCALHLVVRKAHFAEAGDLTSEALQDNEHSQEMRCNSSHGEPPFSRSPAAGWGLGSPLG